MQLTEPAAAHHPHRQQAGAALLDQLARIVRFGQAQLHRRPGRTDTGVAGKREFLHRGEDAHLVAGAVIGRQQKGGFGQVEPGGNGLHRGTVQAVAIGHHGQRIALAGAFAEDIQLQVAALHGGDCRKCGVEQLNVAAQDRSGPWALA